MEPKARTYRDIASDPDHLNVAFAARYIEGRYYAYLLLAQMLEASLHARNISSRPRKEYGERWKALESAKRKFATFNVQGPERHIKHELPE